MKRFKYIKVGGFAVIRGGGRLNNLKFPAGAA